MAKSQAKLTVVEPETNEPIDISALLRAEIQGREHWQGVHISGDKREPVDLPDGRKRTWTK